MVRVEKIEVTDEKATYKYFPEGSSNFGIISLFRKLGSATWKRSFQDTIENIIARP